MSDEALIRQLQVLSPGGKLAINYTEIETAWPPGFADETVKTHLTDLINDCRCDLKDQPEYENIMITKRSGWR